MGRSRTHNSGKIEQHERIVNIANGDLGTANTSYTLIPWGDAGKRMGTLQHNIEATTVTLEATNDSASLVQAGTATWTDINQLLFGAVNRTVTGDWIIDTPVLFAFFRVKRVTTNATNSYQLRLCTSS